MNREYDFVEITDSDGFSRGIYLSVSNVSNVKFHPTLFVLLRFLIKISPELASL